jgi:cell division protease FtsH
MVMQLPERDKLSMSYEQMISRLAILMGGRVAEEIIFGKQKVTSGAASDIEQATKLARAMVTRWGYSDLLGVVAYGENQDEVFLGHSVARTQNVSEETARLIDTEVRKLVQGGHDEARRILNERLEDLHTIAKALLEYETLTGDEITDVLKGLPPRRPDEALALPTGPAVSVPITPAEPQPIAASVEAPATAKRKRAAKPKADAAE